MRFAIAVLLAAVLFGTTGTSQALGPADTTPFSVGTMRIALGGAILALVTFTIAARQRKKADAAAPPRRLDTRSVLLMCLTGASLWAYQPLFFFGTERNGVAVGTVVALGSSPIMAGLIEWAIRRTRPSAIWIGATALATVGVALLAFGGGAEGGADAVGLLGSLGAGATFAIIANAQRRLLDDGWDPFTVVGAMGLTAAIPAIISLPFLDLAWVASGRGAITTLWLAVASLAAAYALFTWGLSGLTAATAATLTLGEPLTAALLGVIVLGEQLSLLAIGGLVVLGTGLALLAWGSRPRRNPGPFPIEA